MALAGGLRRKKSRCIAAMQRPDIIRADRLAVRVGRLRHHRDLIELVAKELRVRKRLSAARMIVLQQSRALWLGCVGLIVAASCATNSYRPSEAPTFNPWPPWRTDHLSECLPDHDHSGCWRGGVRSSCSGDDSKLKRERQFNTLGPRRSRPLLEQESLFCSTHHRLRIRDRPCHRAREG
jgi:hypothetical protein